MENQNDFYTVLVLPGHTSRPYRFSVRKKTCKWLVGTFAIFMLGATGVFADYFAMLGHMTDLSRLRRETDTQRAQIQNFRHTIAQLEQQMTRLSEMDRKMRVLTDTERTSNAPEPEPAAEPARGIGGPEKGNGPPTALGGTADANTLASLRRHLEALKLRASLQEQSFLELVEVAENRKMQWESIPSVWPTRGFLSSGYGRRISPFTGLDTMHEGIDIGSSYGTPVIAPAAGVVSAIGVDGAMGNAVRLDHGGGIVTRFGHLSKTVVQMGRRVRRGEVIGHVGSTGLSTGPHLHYEVNVDGRAVNPMKYILTESAVAPASQPTSTTPAHTPRL